MRPKLTNFNVNWENGMKLNKDHFILQENAFYDRLKDACGIFLNHTNYGLLPLSAIKTIFKVDNQKFLKVRIYQCRAVTPGGARIEILEEHSLPEFETDLSRELEMAAKGAGEDYYIALTIDPLKRQVCGELSANEEPPRYPFTMPVFKIGLLSESQVNKEAVFPWTFFIGKISIAQDPVIYEDYIPPCMTVNSHFSLIELSDAVEKFFCRMELNLLSMIRKIREKNQDTTLSLSILKLSENLLGFITANQTQFRWEISFSPPIRLFEYIAAAARVIRNTIDAYTASGKEELLNYFTNWSELKEGDFEKFLVYCINFDYKHYDIQFSVEQFSEFIQMIASLFDKLESLAYIGKKKETHFFITEQKSAKDQKTRRSFLAD